MSALLSVDRLTVGFPLDGGWSPVVRELSFTLRRGEILGVVGESGCGKSVTALSILGLPPVPGRILGGEVRLAEEAIAGAGRTAARGVRGSRIGMVFQEPASALDPVFSIGSQLVEAIRAHRDLDRNRAHRAAVSLVERVALPDPDRVLAAFPHQLSGGQRQRAMIALALTGEPEILIADEPTTALDVTIQAQILELLERLRKDLDLAIVLITHDLGVIAETCDRALVMYAGEAAEIGPVGSLFTAPRHPYTRALLETMPILGEPGRGLSSIPGGLPPADRLPPGCVFHPRCAEAVSSCSERAPTLVEVGPGHAARCLLVEPGRVGSEAP